MMIDRISFCALISLYLVSASSGCVQAQSTGQQLSLESARTNSGLVLQDVPLDAERGVSIEALQTERRISKIPGRELHSNDEHVEVEPAESGQQRNVWSRDFGTLIKLPKLNALEVNELLDDFELTAMADYGYAEAASTVIAVAPRLPGKARNQKVLARKTGEGIFVIHYGHWNYASRTGRLGIYGGVYQEGEFKANPELGDLLESIEQSLASIQEMREALSPLDLEHRLVQLSFVGMDSAMSSLAALGVKTIRADSTMPEEVSFDSLPIVVELQSPGDTAMGIVAEGELGKGKFGGVIAPTKAGKMVAETVSSPTSRLLVLFHPAHPEQYSRIQKMLDEVIDTPARQIFVEGLIIGIGESGLDELGIEWEFQDGNWNFLLGGTQPGFLVGGDATLDLGVTKSANLSTDWAAKLRALVVDGKGKILSRPSILTLDGRQASIRIGEEIPIATSQEGLTGNASKISFDFDYISLGIVLNIRPRISRDGSEISLMVDTIVSDEVPQAGLQIRNGDGEIVASAPRINSRRVQTYARIKNNTPFIIGGLVSRESTEIESKVPLLGSIPYLGRLFRSTTKTESRNEVIIVLTPYIVPEEVHLSRGMPGGELIGMTDSKLFRKTHQILRGDIVDIGFLYENSRFRRFQEFAEAAVAEDTQLAEQPPFRSFVKGSVPGAAPIVHQILYNTLARVGAEESISQDKLLTLSSLAFDGHETRFLTDTLQIRKEEGETRSFFSEHPGKAIAITFDDLQYSEGPQGILNDPVPAITIVDCSDRAEWKRLLSQMNQVDENGRRRYTIILHTEDDLVRLRLSVLLKYVLEVNGARRNVEILKFIPGRIIEIPRILPNHPQFIDGEIAKIFYHSVHFYSEATKEIEFALKALEQEMTNPKFETMRNKLDTLGVEFRGK